jgi:hypothetical protein
VSEDTVLGEGLVRGWRKLNTEEQHDLYCTPNVIRVIKAKRMGWAWNVACIGKEINIYKVLAGGPGVKKEIGRPRPMGDSWRAICELVNMCTFSLSKFRGNFILY